MITGNSNFNLSSALLAYSDSLRAKAAAAAGKTDKSDEADTATTGKTPTTGTDKTADTLKTIEPSTSTSFKTTRGRQLLEQTQQTLAKALREAVTASGGALKGEVSFALDSTQGLKITGSEEDKKAISAALKADKSSPSLASRLAALTKDALTLETDNRSSAAISQAARHAKTPAAVMSLYSSLMQQQQSTSTTAVFSMSDKTSALTYKGMIDTSA
ncbi:MAG: hypothetical protein ACOZE7_15485 [Pseudomonadota bacterium]